MKTSDPKSTPVRYVTLAATIYVSDLIDCMCYTKLVGCICYTK